MSNWREKIWLKIIALTIAGVFLFSEVTWAARANFTFSLPQNNPNYNLHPASGNWRWRDKLWEIYQDITSFLIPAVYADEISPLKSGSSLIISVYNPKFVWKRVADAVDVSKVEEDAFNSMPTADNPAINLHSSWEKPNLGKSSDEGNLIQDVENQEVISNDTVNDTVAISDIIIEKIEKIKNAVISASSSPVGEPANNAEVNNVIATYDSTKAKLTYTDPATEQVQLPIDDWANKELDYGDFTSQTLTTKAWEAFAAGDLDKAKSYAAKCIQLYSEKAKEQQASLTDYPQADKIKDYWALNDVGTAYFILGEALEKEGQNQLAKAAYQTVINEYGFSQCWDTQGWYWKVAVGAKEKIAQLPDTAENGVEPIVTLAVDDSGKVDYREQENGGVDGGQETKHFIAQKCFYNDDGSLKRIEYYTYYNDPNSINLDSQVTGKIVKDEIGRYFIEEENGTRWLLVAGQKGTNDGAAVLNSLDLEKLSQSGEEITLSGHEYTSDVLYYEGEKTKILAVTSKVKDEQGSGDNPTNNKPTSLNNNSNAEVINNGNDSSVLVDGNTAIVETETQKSNAVENEANPTRGPPTYDYNCAVDALSQLLPNIDPNQLAQDLAQYTQNGQTSLYGIQQVALKYGLNLYAEQPASISDKNQISPIGINDKGEPIYQTHNPDKPVNASKQGLADLLGVKPEEIKVISVEQVDWSDTSLGYPEPGKVYAQGITPGYRIVLEVNGKKYEYHTNLSGSNVKSPLVQLQLQSQNEIDATVDNTTDVLHYSPELIEDSPPKPIPSQLVVRFKEGISELNYLISGLKFLIPPLENVVIPSAQHQSANQNNDNHKPKNNPQDSNFALVIKKNKIEDIQFNSWIEDGNKIIDSVYASASPTGPPSNSTGNVIFLANNSSQDSVTYAGEPAYSTTFIICNNQTGITGTEETQLPDTTAHSTLRNHSPPQ